MLEGQRSSFGFEPQKSVDSETKKLSFMGVHRTSFGGYKSSSRSQEKKEAWFFYSRDQMNHGFEGLLTWCLLDLHFRNKYFKKFLRFSLISRIKVYYKFRCIGTEFFFLSLNLCNLNLNSSNLEFCVRDKKIWQHGQNSIPFLIEGPMKITFTIP